MKWLKNLGITFLIIYAVACIGLFLAQEKIIFIPYQLPEDFQFRAGEEVEIEVDEGISLNCLWLKEPNSKGVIFYLHGNRGSLKRCLYQAQQMDGNQYDIFMPDYRGFGKSDGSVKNEKQMHDDNQKVYDFLKKHYREDQIVIVGYSLGSGMASHIAAENNPQQLFLLAPYYSLIDIKNQYAPILPSFLMKYKFKTHECFKKLDMPITMFHGTNDRVIPYKSSEKLKEKFPDKVELITLRNESHRGTIFNPTFRNTLRKYLK